MISSENRPDDVASQPGWNPGFIAILLACIVGGFVGGLIVHQLHPLFAYEELPPLELGSPPALIKKHHDAAFAYQTQNYASEFAIIGLAFGICIGAFTGGKATFFGGEVRRQLGAAISRRHKTSSIKIFGAPGAACNINPRL